MQRVNKAKKDPVTEWAVGQPLVMQTKLEQETTKKAKLESAPNLARAKKMMPAKQSSGTRKKTAVSRRQLKTKRTSP
jgi:3-polyprenyl-4-hydroxybenzoate decarboxylase